MHGMPESGTGTGLVPTIITAMLSAVNGAATNYLLQLAALATCNSGASGLTSA